MKIPAMQSTRTVLESGFKITPGKENGFALFNDALHPVAISQDGFESVYGGEILDSAWRYVGARFASAEQMDAWHNHPRHKAAQKAAYDRWWTAVYMRKWREPAPGEVMEGKVMTETRLAVPAPLSDANLRNLKEILAGLADSGASPFETLTGEYEAQPYQLVGPGETSPETGGVSYLLITHWPTPQVASAWQETQAYRALQDMGTVTSETFMSMPETRPRDHLREDKLQRQWTLESQR
ncbi:antibiotic biosynthesis monooxygenase family protein [Achromobacter anxifer]|uniref:ABM domain-containing protein n=1 Tax=Achromobacter anxifer TaxID=1287737 RepID=A0A6S7EPD3_9BURK|nr:hypothetical protein [Achromobacter anxifer]MDF8360104.1 hypothetical protein [Achromobacter anxifer]CAB3916422.1 hypothetical protein LMG26858_05039 [Achromobacter anxifer]CAB5517086.1 hypothetical protein LMG26857_06170 [Achromobacter anxifer]